MTSELIERFAACDTLAAAGSVKGVVVSFRDNLLRLRTEHNMTQEQLASLIGVSRQSVAKWESDRSYPEMDKLIKMTGIFDCTLDDLVMGPMGHDAIDDRDPRVLNAPTAAPADGEEEATDKHGYDTHMRSYAKRMAWGVAGIILGVACMLFVEAFFVARGSSTDNPFTLIALFAGIAIGLLLIIPAVMGHTSFLREHPVVKDFYSAEQKRKAGERLAVGLVAGVALIFLGIVLADPGEGDGTALIYSIARSLSPDSAYLIASSVGAGVTLTCIAAAVWCFIYFGIMHSRVHVRNYNDDSLNEIVDACGKARLAPEEMLSQLSPEERQLLFDPEGIDGNDADQVGAYFKTRYRKGKFAGTACSIIMILATMAGLCLMFGFPVYSSVFWMAWVVGGLLCAIACVVINAVVK